MFLQLTPEQQHSRALESYDRLLEEFEDARETAEEAIREALTGLGLRVHSIVGRVKTRESFGRKVAKDTRRQVEDMVGVRVITYFREDIRTVERAIRELFVVHDGTYVDKSRLLAPREFGYKSIQFIGHVMPMGPGSDRDQLPNRMTNGRWMGSTDGTVEFQIRSLLEHAWAEVEHDLAYKSGVEISAGMRRRFALTAALLETADEQLDGIRGDLLEPRNANGEDSDDLPDGWVQRFVETDLGSIDLDDNILAALDLPKGRPEKYMREVSRSVALGGFMNTKDVRRAFEQNRSLSRRMAIVCSDVAKPLLMPDFHPVLEDLAQGFPGIGLYWLGMAVGVSRDTRAFDAFPSVPNGRLLEYRVVVEYLNSNPAVPAPIVREKYRSLAAPAGARSYPTIRLV